MLRKPRTGDFPNDQISEQLPLTRNQLPNLLERNSMIPEVKSQPDKKFMLHIKERSNITKVKYTTEGFAPPSLHMQSPVLKPATEKLFNASPKDHSTAC